MFQARAPIVIGPPTQPEHSYSAWALGIWIGLYLVFGIYVLFRPWIDPWLGPKIAKLARHYQL